MLARLNRLRAEAARLEAGDQEHIHPRNSVLDLVVVASDPGDAEAAAAVVGELAGHHPCRAVIVLDEPGAGGSRIDAALTSVTQPLFGCPACQLEQVFLRVRGPAAGHIPSLVDSLLVPDVVNYLWWTGSPPLDSERFRESLAVADAVLVDGARFERPRPALASLAAHAAASPVAFGDLQWARLAPWREVLAQFFNPAPRAGFLAGIAAVEIDYAAGRVGNPTAAALLGGWLASALGWSLVKAAAGSRGAARAAYRSRQGGAVEVRLRPVAGEGLAAGEVARVQIRASSEGREGELQARRDRRDPGRVEVTASIAGSPVPRLVLAVPTQPDAVLLSRLLVEARRDRGYPAALRRAAEVLASSRG